MKIHVLVDNNGDEGSALTCEDGLSFIIKRAEGTVLYDTGVTGVFADNARRMGLDIASVACAVISHGHYDHAGGLRRFLTENTTAPVLLHPGAWTPHRSMTTGALREIGMDATLRAEYRDRFVHLDTTTERDGMMFIVPGPERAHPSPAGNSTLLEERGGENLPDRFEHETILAVRDRDGIAVFCACSHMGVENALDAVERACPGVPVKGYFGGFHMMNPRTKKMTEPEESVRAIAQRLLARNVARFWTGHCTGDGAFAVLKDEMGDRVARLSTGGVITL